MQSTLAMWCNGGSKKVMENEEWRNARKHRMMTFWTTHQFGVELLRRTAAVHGHEGLRGRGDAAVVQVERSLALRSRAVLRTAGEQRSVLGVNLKGGKLVSIEIQKGLDAVISAREKPMSHLVV